MELLNLMAMPFPTPFLVYLYSFVLLDLVRKFADLDGWEIWS